MLVSQSVPRTPGRFLRILSLSVPPDKQVVETGESVAIKKVFQESIA